MAVSLFGRIAFPAFLGLLIQGVHPLCAILFLAGQDLYHYLYLELMKLTCLPSEYCKRMKNMLGVEYPKFISAYSRPAYRGIRLNTLKCSFDALESSLPFPVEPSPFSPLEFYIPSDVEKIGHLPMHHAGAFYVQEPSASSAVTVLSPQAGEKILDLCAAPGGKSTQIASLMGGKGLLWSNEIIPKRAEILLSNLERIGARNAVVSCCHPDVLCHRLQGFFDRVLIDAPCSGEGMFRRSDKAVRDWSPEHVKACAARQLAILESASLAIKENGVLVYSTCTFSEEENEWVISAFLKNHTDFEMEDCGVSFGRPAFLPKARRIFPMDGGEGHFVSKMRRLSANQCCLEYCHPKEGRETEPARELLGEILSEEPKRFVVRCRDRFYILPDFFPQTDADSLGVMRAGILAGTLHPGRVEPAHALYMAARPEEMQNVVSFAHDSKEISAFLHGEELEVPSAEKGWCGVAVDSVMAGFGKCSSGRLKNHYPKGLRNAI